MVKARRYLALVGVCTLLATGCNTEEDAVKPLAATDQDELVGWADAVCNLVQSFGENASPGPVSVIQENGVLINVTTQRRGHNGRYLSESEGLLIDGDTSPDMIGTFDAHILGVHHMLTVPDESGEGVNQRGGRVILDFSPVGSVTLRDMIITDIEEGEEGSKVELFSGTGQLLLSKALVAHGDKTPYFVSLENVPGVTKAIVTFGSERSLKGSGAIARIQMCKEGTGRCVNACEPGINSLWVQYTGKSATNVKVLSGTGAELMAAHGMKPGTMFKLTDADDLRGIRIVSNKKHDPAATIDCSNGMLAMAGGNGLFRIVEARSDSYSYPLCVQH